MSRDNSSSGQRGRRPNGRGSVFLYRGRWKVRVSVPGTAGKIRKEVSAHTKEEAEAALHEYLANGSWVKEDVRKTKGANRVYFIEAVGVNLIKIGITANLEGRFATFRKLSPVPLEVLHTINGAGRETEVQLHDRFAHLRMHGEWFCATPELRRYIAELENPCHQSHPRHTSDTPAESVSTSLF